MSLFADINSTRVTRQLQVHLERCNNCQLHPRMDHDEDQMDEMENQIRSLCTLLLDSASQLHVNSPVLKSWLREEATNSSTPNRIKEELIQFPRVGSFEVYVSLGKKGDRFQRISSKLSSGSWPSLRNLKKKLSSFLRPRIDESIFASWNESMYEMLTDRFDGCTFSSVSIRALALLPRYCAYVGKWEQLCEYLLCNVFFLARKTSELGVDEVIRDFDFALKCSALPAANRPWIADFRNFLVKAAPDLRKNPMELARMAVDTPGKVGDTSFRWISKVQQRAYVVRDIVAKWKSKPVLVVKCEELDSILSEMETLSKEMVFLQSAIDCGLALATEEIFPEIFVDHSITELLQQSRLLLQAVLKSLWNNEAVLPYDCKPEQLYHLVQDFVGISDPPLVVTAAVQADASEQTLKEHLSKMLRIQPNDVLGIEVINDNSNRRFLLSQSAVSLNTVFGWVAASTPPNSSILSISMDVYILLGIVLPCCRRTLDHSEFQRLLLCDMAHALGVNVSKLSALLKDEGKASRFMFVTVKMCGVRESVSLCENLTQQMRSLTSPLLKGLVTKGLVMLSYSFGQQPPNLPGEWTLSQAYICGTTLDLLSERELLVKQVLPALRATCRRIRVEFSWADIRSLQNETLPGSRIGIGEQLIRFKSLQQSTLMHRMDGSHQCPLVLGFTGSLIGPCNNQEEQQQQPIIDAEFEAAETITRDCIRCCNSCSGMFLWNREAGCLNSDPNFKRDAPAFLQTDFEQGEVALGKWLEKNCELTTRSRYAASFGSFVGNLESFLEHEKMLERTIKEYDEELQVRQMELELLESQRSKNATEEEIVELRKLRTEVVRLRRETEKMKRILGEKTDADPQSVRGCIVSGNFQPMSWEYLDFSPPPSSQYCQGFLRLQGLSGLALSVAKEITGVLGRNRGVALPNGVGLHEHVYSTHRFVQDSRRWITERPIRNLTGRQHPRTALLESIEGAEHCSIILRGKSGSGKSTLALQLAHQLRNRCSDPVVAVVTDFVACLSDLFFFLGAELRLQVEGVSGLLEYDDAIGLAAKETSCSCSVAEKFFRSSLRQALDQGFSPSIILDGLDSKQRAAVKKALKSEASTSEMLSIRCVMTCGSEEEEEELEGGLTEDSHGFKVVDMPKLSVGETCEITMGWGVHLGMKEDVLAVWGEEICQSDEANCSPLYLVTCCVLGHQIHKEDEGDSIPVHRLKMTEEDEKKVSAPQDQDDVWCQWLDLLEKRHGKEIVMAAMRLLFFASIDREGASFVLTNELAQLLEAQQFCPMRALRLRDDLVEMLGCCFFFSARCSKCLVMGSEALRLPWASLIIQVELRYLSNDAQLADSALILKQAKRFQQKTDKKISISSSNTVQINVSVFDTISTTNPPKLMSKKTRVIIDEATGSPLSIKVKSPRSPFLAPKMPSFLGSFPSSPSNNNTNAKIAAGGGSPSATSPVAMFGRSGSFSIYQGSSPGSNSGANTGNNASSQGRLKHLSAALNEARRQQHIFHEEVKLLMSQNGVLKQELVEVRNELEDVQKHNEQLLTELLHSRENSDKAETHAMTEQLAAKTDISTLQLRLKSLEVQVAKSRVELQTVTDEKTALEMERAKEAGMRAENKRLAKALEDANANLDKTEKIKQTREKELATMKKKHQETLEALWDSQKEKKEAEKQLSEAKINEQKLLRMVDSLNFTIEGLRKEKVELVGVVQEKESIGEMLVARELELRELQEQYCASKKRMDELEVLVDRERSINSAQQVYVSEAKSKIEGAEKRSTGLQRQLELMERDKQYVQSLLAASEGREEQLQGVRRDLEVEVARLNERMKTATADVTSQRDTLQFSLKRLQEDHLVLSDNLRASQKNVALLEDKVLELEKALHKEAIQKEVMQWVQQENRIRGEKIASLEQKLAQSKAANEHLEMQIANANSMLDSVMEGKEDVVASLKAKVNELQELVRTKEERIQAVIEGNRDKNDELARLKFLWSRKPADQKEHEQMLNQLDEYKKMTACIPTLRKVADQAKVMKLELGRRARRCRQERAMGLAWKELAVLNQKEQANLSMPGTCNLASLNLVCDQVVQKMAMAVTIRAGYFIVAERRFDVAMSKANKRIMRLQATVRGHWGRKRFAAKKRERLVLESAKTVQKFFKGIVERKKEQIKQEKENLKKAKEAPDESGLLLALDAERNRSTALEEQLAEIKSALSMAEASILALRTEVFIMKDSSNKEKESGGSNHHHHHHHHHNSKPSLAVPSTPSSSVSSSVSSAVSKGKRPPLHRSASSISALASTANTSGGLLLPLPSPGRLSPSLGHAGNHGMWNCCSHPDMDGIGCVEGKHAADCYRCKHCEEALEKTREVGECWFHPGNLEESGESKILKWSCCGNLASDDDLNPALLKFVTWNGYPQQMKRGCRKRLHTPAEDESCSICGCAATGVCRYHRGEWQRRSPSPSPSTTSIGFLARAAAERIQTSDGFTMIAPISYNSNENKKSEDKSENGSNKGSSSSDNEDGGDVVAPLLPPPVSPRLISPRGSTTATTTTTIHNKPPPRLLRKSMSFRS